MSQTDTESKFAGGAEITMPNSKDHRDDFIALCGIWSDEEMREFEKNTACFSETETPAWHGDVLRETEARATSGEEHAVDWEIAKTRIQLKGF
jgi:hypothetical protein